MRGAKKIDYNSIYTDICKYICNIKALSSDTFLFKFP